MTDKQPYDYSHMKRALDSLMLAWRRNPYLRLGQLISNSIERNDGPGLFNIEDDKLADAAIKFSEV